MVLVRTPEALKEARAVLGLSADALARIVRVEDGRTVRRWEAGEREIPGPVIVILETAMGYLDSIKLINTQLEMLRSCKMRSGETTRAGRVDQTPADIERLTASRKSLMEALEILTRQPSDDGSDRVHWYTLKRSTPLFDPALKDEWTVPGELSPEAALAYFAKHEGFGEGLEIADDEGPVTEFILEKREVLRRHVGASQRLSAGRLVETFSVRQRFAGHTADKVRS
jgi:transcriptional regulator with XRE-family HTH domain